MTAQAPGDRVIELTAVPLTPLKRLGKGRYLTADGAYIIESDNASADEWDRLSDPEWFVYAGAMLNKDYGPPDAIGDGHATRRAALQSITGTTTDR